MKRMLAITLIMTTLTCVGIGCFKTPAAKATDVNVNLIDNGYFDDELNEWGIYTTSGGKGKILLENGSLKVDIIKCGNLEYGVQVFYGGFNLHKNGKYKLEFDISSDVDRFADYRIQKNHGNYDSYVDGRINIGKQSKTIATEFVMNEHTDKDPRLVFNLGKIYGQDLKKHSVKIDNVRLFLLDDSQVDVNEKLPIHNSKIVLNQIGYKPNDIKKAVFREYSQDDTFRVVSDKDGAVVYEGKIYGGMFNEAAGETDYFGDFSSVNVPGDYRIENEKLGTSFRFTIGENIYNNLFNDLFKYFYYQRCGENLTSEYAGEWSHAACHTEYARIYGTDKKIDVSGGWHDAGDYGRYITADSKAIADLLSAYNDNKNIFGDNTGIPESGNGMPDVLDEVKLQLQWMMKMQEQDNGGVYHKVTCADFPGYVMPQYETGELIVSPISTTATADFAAVMAMGYESFKSIDDSFANQCLRAAEKAWTYLEYTPNNGGFKNPEGILTGEYADGSDSDERYWAAAQLFKATGDRKYDSAFRKIVGDEGIKTGYGWIDTGNYGNIAYLAAEGADYDLCNGIKNVIAGIADDIVYRDKNDGYSIPLGTNYYWGNNMGISNDTVLLTKAYEIIPKQEYLEYAEEHINYCLGKNSLGMSFVTGYGSEFPKNPHHRPSIAAEKAIPGMIVGGPDGYLEDPYVEKMMKYKPAAQRYVDNEESYSTNEVDIYWNSAFIYALSQTVMK